MIRFPSVAIATLLLFAPELAFAHAHLHTATPAEAASVTEAPVEVALSFTEALERSLSTITVLDAAGRRVDDGPVRAPEANRLTVRLKPLPAGVYTVQWSVTSVDTHRSEGHYSFTVAP